VEGRPKYDAIDDVNSVPPSPPTPPSPSPAPPSSSTAPSPPAPPPRKPSKASTESSSPLRAALLVSKDEDEPGVATVHIANPAVGAADDSPTKKPPKPVRNNNGHGDDSPQVGDGDSSSSKKGPAKNQRKAASSAGYDMATYGSNTASAGYKPCGSHDDNDDVDRNDDGSVQNSVGGDVESASISNSRLSVHDAADKQYNRQLQKQPAGQASGTGAVSAVKPPSRARDNMYEAIKKRKEFLSPGDSNSTMYHLNSVSSVWLYLTIGIHLVQWSLLLTVGNVVIPTSGMVVLCFLGERLPRSVSTNAGTMVMLLCCSHIQVLLFPCC
jgi:hypothetical protein